MDHDDDDDDVGIKIVAGVLGAVIAGGGNLVTVQLSLTSPPETSYRQHSSPATLTAECKYQMFQN